MDCWSMAGAESMPTAAVAAATAASQPPASRPSHLESANFHLEPNQTLDGSAGVIFDPWLSYDDLDLNSMLTQTNSSTISSGSEQSSCSTQSPAGQLPQNQLVAAQRHQSGASSNKFHQTDPVGQLIGGQQDKLTANKQTMQRYANHHVHGVAQTASGGRSLMARSIQAPFFTLAASLASSPSVSSSGGSPLQCSPSSSIMSQSDLGRQLSSSISPPNLLLPVAGSLGPTGGVNFCQSTGSMMLQANVSNPADLVLGGDEHNGNIDFLHVAGGHHQHHNHHHHHHHHLHHRHQHLGQESLKRADTQDSGLRESNENHVPQPLDFGSPATEAARAELSSSVVRQPTNRAQAGGQKARRCRHITDYVLAEEEKRLLIKEGYLDFPMSSCQSRPLSKGEERILRKIRRKIRNKRSAQCSRQRKKEYVEELERKYASVLRQNEELRDVLAKFQQQQQQHDSYSNQQQPQYLEQPKGGRDNFHGAEWKDLFLTKQEHQQQQQQQHLHHATNEVYNC